MYELDKSPKINVTVQIRITSYKILLQQSLFSVTINSLLRISVLSSFSQKLVFASSIAANDQLKQRIRDFQRIHQILLLPGLTKKRKYLIKKQSIMFSLYNSGIRLRMI